jgi:hypothetical protein
MSHRVTHRSRQLLSTLLDNPDLPLFVRRLPAPVLKRLVDRVGLEDAGALIALTTSDQFRDLFEASLWQDLTPGAADSPSPSEFQRWLGVLVDHDPAFAAERLRALGVEFVAAHLAPAVRVLEKSATVFMIQNDAWLEFDDHVVSIVDPDAGDALPDLLRALYAEDAELIARIFAACCFLPTARGFADTDEIRQADEAFSRRTRRAQLGYVTPEMARAFLTHAQRAPLDALAAQHEYDGLSAECLVRRATPVADPVEAAITDAVDPPDVQRAPDARNIRALEAALVEARVVEAEAPARLLSGPREAPNEPILKLQQAMDDLQYRDPEAFSARLGELAYLANVLMTGSWNRGERFEEADAARAALACANLGLDHLERQTASVLAGVLAEPPGLVRPFQIGWHLVQALPRRAGEALVSVLRDEHVHARLSRRQWLLDEVLLAINEPDLLVSIDNGEFDDVSDNLRLVSLVVDRRVCHCLDLLIADVPRFPLQLNVGLRPAGRAVRASRYVAEVMDLRKIHAMLRELEAHVRP